MWRSVTLRNDTQVIPYNKFRIPHYRVRNCRFVKQIQRCIYFFINLIQNVFVVHNVQAFKQKIFVYINFMFAVRYCNF